jgi:hypothetical protein
MFLSITGVTADNRIAKYQEFENEADADTHAAAYSGFVVEDPGGNQMLWTIDASAKTVTRNADVEAAAATALAWEQTRIKRNQLLTESDWRGMSDLTMSDAWKTYRQALRDLPANTADPTDVTWPTKPS